MNIQALIDTQIDRGTATGQLVSWNETTKRWEKTDESELKWDKVNTILIITGTTRTGRVLAGGVA